MSADPFRWTPEHEEFRAVLRKLTESRTPLACAPAPASADQRERELWRAWADELGLPGLVVPESHGGAGFSRLELAIAAEELGRAVAGGPLFASAVLATEALLATGPDAAAAEILPALAGGTSVAALAVVEESHRWAAADVRTRVGDGRLTGVKHAVLGAADADVLVVAAREDAGVSLFLVEPGTGVEIVPLAVLDPSRPAARVDLTGAPARRIGVAGEGWPAVERALEAGAVFLAAEQVGGSRALLDAAVEHANTRVQFGRPVGQFQGVKHRLADMAVRTELAAAAATWAAWQEPGTDTARLGAAVARAHCADAYLETALDAIGVHGGMAITWEHHAHRYLRRARADLAVLPGPAEQRRLLETMIGTGV
ncbi:acyl-CoA dehydrogenase family protein [Actinophytocola gossypii]|uniref:Acyl-CoA/acyl-ACP dehydrogenase n=1 Tax=Actinophytocola gossypii TaxID=2812003 RepID=A0ABT2J8B4_9PSEU|nr:acyl-CoA dehydrogenase family protein [Actinophytocola gossypii]MCT2583524.1 acyl-CoA/acyl-ACP dehydrogenase [Actinophytocola gossypii]